MKHRTRPLRKTRGWLALLALLAFWTTGRGEENGAGVEFFEKRIRPLLVQHCYRCHSDQAKKVKGELRLDTRATIRRGGVSGPALVPGKPAESLLLKAVRYDTDLRMPPKGKLTAAEIADLETWIKMGAPDPRTGDVAAKKNPPNIEEGKKYWAFQPIKNPATLPAVKDAAWPRTSIDHFILAKLEARGFKPVGPAERRTWLRRATYDLTGLPPTPAELEQFLRDDSADAYDRVIERLLASPAYGERWGRHWLDVVRYADTAGDNSDYPIPQMVKYRDWVIAAINHDLPYDQFVRQQIAGDLMPAKSDQERRDQIIATGYLANARRHGSYEDARYPWHLTIEDTIDNLGKAFLGVTISCARCHDHKFDPFTIEDYYGLYGFFSSTRYPWPGIELEKKPRDLIPLPGPAKGELAYAVIDGMNEPKKRIGQVGDARVQLKGDPDYPGKIAPRRFPLVLGGQTLPKEVKGSGRLELARWLTDQVKPLLARVMVNRIWQHHFGRGIVGTANNFGKLGQPPTHPELLDHLAQEFIRNGWSLKKLHRQIMRSRVYQLSGEEDAAHLKADPGNELLWRFPRRRLDAEEIRDTLLALGGNLEPGPGGPHPFPDQKKWDFSQHRPFKAVYPSNRRSVYLMTQRIVRHPFLALFDGPDTNASTASRPVSTTPLQALFLMNDPFVHEQGRRFTARLLAEQTEDIMRIEQAFLLAFGRPATEEERGQTRSYLNEVANRLRQSGTPMDQLATRAWESFARALFMSNELVYVN